MRIVVVVVTAGCLIGCAITFLVGLNGLNNSITVAATAAAGSAFVALAIFFNLAQGLELLYRQNEEQIKALQEQNKYLRYLARTQQEQEGKREG